MSHLVEKCYKIIFRCSEWLLKNSFRFKEGEGEKILENLLSQKISHTNPQETVNFLIDLGTDPCHKNPKTGNQVWYSVGLCKLQSKS